MAKINQKEEKRARNELYAKKFKKKEKPDVPKPTGKNWCRVKGHPLTCTCVY